MRRAEAAILLTVPVPSKMPWRFLLPLSAFTSCVRKSPPPSVICTKRPVTSSVLTPIRPVFRIPLSQLMLTSSDICWQVAVMIMTFMSVDRFLAIVYPMVRQRASSHMSRTVLCCMTFIWTCGITLALIPGRWRERLMHRRIWGGGGSEAVDLVISKSAQNKAVMLRTLVYVTG